MSALSNLLLLHKPGGGLPDQPKVELTKGFSFNSSSVLTGRVTDLALSSLDIVEPDCYAPDCYEGSGVWTTAIRTSTSKTVLGVTYYWVPGYLDTSGYAWTIDVGVICPTTGEMSVLEQHVALSSSLTFESTKPLRSGLKVALLKKVNTNTVTNVSWAFGDYGSADRLTRSNHLAIAQYTASHQTVDLEELALALLSTVNSPAQSNQAGVSTFGLYGERPELTQILQSNFDRLARLVDLTSITQRVGSLPKTLATYLEAEDLYGKKADDLYSNPVIRIYEEGCVDEDCTAANSSPLLVSREVRTRAIAWLLYTLTEYTISSSNDKYTTLIQTLSSYLINQIDPSTYLVREGWTNTNKLEDSLPLLGYFLSTAVASFLALGKVYELTGNDIFLHYSSFLKEGILNSLFDLVNGRFLHSIESGYSAEAFIYGLVFSLAIGRTDLVELSIKDLEKNSISNYGLLVEDYLRNGGGSLISDGAGGYQYATSPYLTSSTIAQDPLRLLVIQTSDLDSASLNSAIRLNLLLLDSLTLAKTNQYIVPESILNSLKYFTDWIDNHPPFGSTGFYAYGLGGSYSPFLGKETIRSLDNLTLDKTIVYNRLLTLLKGRGEKNKSDLAMGFASVLANWYVGLKRLIRSVSLQGQNRLQLKTAAVEYGLASIPYESETNLRGRVQNYLSGNSLKLTRSEIESYLKDLGIEAEVKDTWTEVQTLNTFEDEIGNSKLGYGYFGGSDRTSATIFQLIVKQPTSQIWKYLKGLGGAGTKPRLIEQLSFEVEKEVVEEEVQVAYSLEETIMTESGESLLMENYERLILE